MTSGCFDHSAIWSRTKIWRRNRSSVVCASAINSNEFTEGGSWIGSEWSSSARVASAIMESRQGVAPRHAFQVVDRDPFVKSVLSARFGTVRDRGDAGRSAEAVAVVDERFGSDGQGMA